MFLNPLLTTLSRWLWRHNIKPNENVVGIKKNTLMKHIFTRIHRIYETTLLNFRLESKYFVSFLSSHIHA